MQTSLLLKLTMAASPSNTQSVHAPTIVYALYGKANSQELALWQRTWLQGKQFVFVPDAPVGPFAHLYRPVHRGHGKMPKGRGSRQGAPSSLFRFKADANMVWAAHAANASYPEVSSL
tara:strand:- start:49 stop:402 length:354 start_codon:yes stop_codon:yes gene_type:complete